MAGACGVRARAAVHRRYRRLDNHGPLEDWGARGLGAVAARGAARARRILPRGKHALLHVVHFVFLVEHRPACSARSSRHVSMRISSSATSGSRWPRSHRSRCCSGSRCARTAPVRWPDADAAERAAYTAARQPRRRPRHRLVRRPRSSRATRSRCRICRCSIRSNSRNSASCCCCSSGSARPHAKATRCSARSSRARLLAVALIVLLTAITLRGAHFLGGVPWSDDIVALAARAGGIVDHLDDRRHRRDAARQAARLARGMVRRRRADGRRDRQTAADRPRTSARSAAIIGVLVVGVLLVAVGYFAPAPPRASGENA